MRMRPVPYRSMCQKCGIIMRYFILFKDQALRVKCDIYVVDINAQHVVFRL